MVFLVYPGQLPFSTRAKFHQTQAQPSEVQAHKGQDLRPVAAPEPELHP